MARGEVRCRVRRGVERGMVWAERGAGGEIRGARSGAGIGGVAATEEEPQEHNTGANRKRTEGGNKARLC